jgi:hypothetical protein
MEQSADNSQTVESSQRHAASRTGRPDKEIRVLLVNVEDERDWWVFKPMRELPSDWASCEGYYLWPVDDLQQAELEAHHLMDRDERAFVQRGAKERIDRSAAFRGNVVLRCPAGHDFSHYAIMNSEDVAAADADFATAQRFVAEREAQEAALVAQQAATTERKAAAAQEAVAVPAQVKAPVTAVPRGNKKTSQPTAAAPRSEKKQTPKASAQYYLLAPYELESEDGDGDWAAADALLIDLSGDDGRAFALRCSLTGLFTLSMELRPDDEPIVRKKGTAVKPEDVAVVTLPFKTTAEPPRAVRLSALKSFFGRPKATFTVIRGAPAPRKKTAHRRGRSPSSGDEKEVRDSGARNDTKGSPRLLQAAPSRKAHRVEEAAKGDEWDGTNSTLRCAGHRLWTTTDHTRPAKQYTPGEVIAPSTNDTAVVALSSSVFVTARVADVHAVVAARKQSGPEESAPTTPATEAAIKPSGVGDQYLVDLLDCIASTQV